MNNYFEPRQIINILLRWWWVLAIAILMGIVVGYGVNQSQAPVYEATATVMVGEFIQTPQLSRDDIAARDAYTHAYAELARRQPILDKVVQVLSLHVSWRQLRDRVDVEVVQNTPLIEVTAKADSPQEAQTIAEEIANQLVFLSQPAVGEDSQHQFAQQEVESLQARITAGHERLTTLQAQINQTRSADRLVELKTEIDTLQRFVTDWEDTYSRMLILLEPDVSQNNLTIIEEAQAKSQPVFPRLSLNVLLGAVIGLGFALVGIFLIDQYDDRVRTSEALEQELGLKHLGTISKIKGKGQAEKLIPSHKPLFGAALFYKKILDNLGFFEKGDRPVKSLLVTSSHLRAGKTTIASNLGIMMAKAGFKTIIVDVDWKNPTQHLLFDLPNETGLMDLLTNADLSTKEQLRATGVTKLQILTTGNLPDDPVEKLQPDRMKQILSDLTKVSDVIILDAPSTNIAESAVLFGLVEGVILVIDFGRTTMKSVKQSVSSVHLTSGKLLGGILNRSPSPWSIV